MNQLIIANTQHSIRANLYDDPNDFIARVSSEQTFSVEDICTKKLSYQLFNSVLTKTSSVNDQGNSRNLKIKGYKLKLAGNNANVGVFFVKKTSPQERIRWRLRANIQTVYY